MVEANAFHQQIKEKRNQKQIIKLITLKPKTYKELASEVSFSGQTLAKHLRRLLATSEIEKEILNGEAVYKLGDKKTTNPADVTFALEYIKRLKKRGGVACYNYSQLGISLLSSILPWGISPYALMDKDLHKVPFLTQDDVEEIEQLLFKKMSQNIKNDRIKRNVINGNFQLGFNVDYAELLKSIEMDSLNYYAVMSKEESHLLDLVNCNREASTDEIEKFYKLREKTYQKMASKRSQH
jgi:hypothetical protein